MMDIASQRDRDVPLVLRGTDRGGRWGGVRRARRLRAWQPDTLPSRAADSGAGIRCRW